jgi:hypothetical protein
MENDEKKYQNVINKLKGLKEVKAPANFETDLKRKINSEKFVQQEKKGFWKNILVPARLIPSLGLVAAAIVFFYVVDTNSGEMDNPFMIEPRVREDIVEVTDYAAVKQEYQKELTKQKSLKKNEPAIKHRTNENELKAHEEKKILGGEKSGEIEDRLDEKDFARDQGITEGKVTTSESTFTDVAKNPQPTAPADTDADMVTGQIITKEELNFRQVQLSPKEQKVVDDLKIQVQSLEKADKHQK